MGIFYIDRRARILEKFCSVPNKIPFRLQKIE
jgi:hypothetical protein